MHIISRKPRVLDVKERTTIEVFDDTRLQLPVVSTPPYRSNAKPLAPQYLPSRWTKTKELFRRNGNSWFVIGFISVVALIVQTMVYCEARDSIDVRETELNQHRLVSDSRNQQIDAREKSLAERERIAAARDEARQIATDELIRRIGTSK